jgi:hypothetical protein
MNRFVADNHITAKVALQNTVEVMYKRKVDLSKLWFISE